MLLCLCTYLHNFPCNLWLSFTRNALQWGISYFHPLSYAWKLNLQMRSFVCNELSSTLIHYFCYVTGLAMQQASDNVEHDYHNCFLRFVDIQLWRHFKYSYFNMAKLEVAKFNRWCIYLKNWLFWNCYGKM